MTNAVGEFNQFTLVIRSSGERSAEACRRLLREEAPGVEPLEIGGLSFRDALRQTLTAGIERKHPWLLVVDADLLVARGAIERFIQHASTLPESVAFCVSWQLDKLFVGIRKGGLKLYRASLLGRALEALDTVPKEALRPEFDMIRLLADEGLSYQDQTGIVCCLHDYEQYYRDIYRKAYLHARKHRDFMPLLMPVWERLQMADADYQVALCGARDGLRHRGSVSVNVTPDPGALDRVLDNLGLMEKETDALSHLTSETVRNMIDAWKPLPGTASLMRRAGISSTSSGWERLLELGRAMGWPEAVTWATGGKLKAVGVGLMGWAERRAESRQLRRMTLRDGTPDG